MAGAWQRAQARSPRGSEWLVVRIGRPEHDSKPRGAPASLAAPGLGHFLPGPLVMIFLGCSTWTCAAQFRSSVSDMLWGCCLPVACQAWLQADKVAACS